MKEAIQVGLNSVWGDFKGWGLMDRAWLIIAVGAIFMSTLLMESSTLDIVTAVANVMCVLLVAKGRLSNFYWGLVGVTGMAVVAFNAKLYGTAALNVMYIAAQFWGWWTWYSSMRKTGTIGADVVVKRLSNPMMFVIFAWACFAIVIVATLFEHYSDNPFPYPDAAMLVYSLVATVMMVKHYAEQWLYWTGANAMCIYMWVLPALDGDGSLPIVVMWTVFTINALYGLYKWYWVKENK